MVGTVGEVTRVGEPLWMQQGGPKSQETRAGQWWSSRFSIVWNATVRLASHGAGNEPKTSHRSTGVQGEPGRPQRAAANRGPHADVGCTTNSSLHQLRRNPLRAVWWPRLRHSLQHSFGTALTVVAAHAVRPVQLVSRTALLAFANTSLPWPIFGPDRQRKSGSAAFGQIVLFRSSHK